jgi:hypothetical protein
MFTTLKVGLFGRPKQFLASSFDNGLRQSIIILPWYFFSSFKKTSEAFA